MKWLKWYGGFLIMNSICVIVMLEYYILATPWSMWKTIFGILCGYCIGTSGAMGIQHVREVK